jgi:hypothetical protein
MSVKDCSRCGGRASGDARFCERCGHEFSNDPPVPPEPSFNLSDPVVVGMPNDPGAGGAAVALSPPIERDDTASPSGIDGWLLLPAIGLAVAPIADLIRLGGLMQSGPDDLGTLVIPLAALLLGLVAFDLFVLARFAAKHPSTRLLFVSLYVLRPLVAFAFAVANPRADTGTFLLQVLASVVWVPYFLLSRRVRNTFRAAPGAATTPVPVSSPAPVPEPGPVPAAVLAQEPAAALALTVPYLKAWLIFCFVV